MQTPFHPSEGIETNIKDEGTSVAIATVLHALLLLWNPMMLRSGFQAPHDFVTIDVVDSNPSAAPAEAPEKPQKMSLMDTLKDMLSTPQAQDLAGPAPKGDARPAPLPVAPVLKERSSPRMSPTFIPKSQTDELATAASPDTIAGGLRNMPSLPSAGPSLQAKSFGGIRAKDLPFAMSGADSDIAGGHTVAIAVGNKTAKAALGYSAPALQESARRRVGIQGLGGGAGNADDLASLGQGSGSAPIAIAGTGGRGTAPAGGGQGNSLSQRGGGGRGLVSGAMFGRGGGGSGVGSGLPSAAADLEAQITSSGGSSKTVSKSKKAFDLAGPVGNRPIMRKVIPQYPSWAEERGLTGTVRLYFTVSPEGGIRSTSIRVTKTTGSLELDQVAIDALKLWQFAPLGSAEDEKGQWGIITFTFSLAG